MPFQYLTNFPLDEAAQTYLDALKSRGMAYKTETIPTTAALGRVTSGPVYAKICAPHYNACAMDGIALDAAKTFGATETTPVHLHESDFVRVDTGRPAVFRLQCCGDDSRTSSRRMAWLCCMPPPFAWQPSARLGEDISAGDYDRPFLYHHHACLHGRPCWRARRLCARGSCQAAGGGDHPHWR